MNERHVIDSLATEVDRIGFYGKVPTHGDFVATGLSRTLQAGLDDWIQAGMLALQTARGRDWEKGFRAATVWRFVVDRSVWGQSTVTGVLLPSRDRVGRSFPLVIAAKLGSFSANPRLLCFDDTWFTAAEALAETSLADDFDLAGLMAGLKRLRLPKARAPDATRTNPLSEKGGVSIWWKVDPETHRPSGFETLGAPQTSHFLKLFEAAGAEAAKKAIEQNTTTAGVLTPRAPLSGPAAATIMHARSPSRGLPIERSHATHPGTRSTLNSGALLVSDNPTLFALADGFGDGGADAAKLAANTLASVSAHDAAENLLQDVKGKLGRAHGLLQSAQTMAGRAKTASVAVLTILHDDLSVVWAGDSRCYLMRDGMMRCLTRDHVEIGMRRALSRSIGAFGPLTLDMLHETALPGDRLLLCNAMLARVLDERAIAETLRDRPVKETAAILIQDALIANAREAVSAIVVGLGTA